MATPGRLFCSAIRLCMWFLVAASGNSWLTLLQALLRARRQVRPQSHRRAIPMDAEVQLYYSGGSLVPQPELPL